mmetsp:Transcript_155310/g.275502  ORF Transcript_155310/g.275502 Transcript_155310/m.275502 type:complete len:341 (+) Transcript_155310:72-1094(+)
MKTILAVLISVTLLIALGLLGSLLLLPLAAAAQSTFCIDITDKSYDQRTRQYFSAEGGCGSDDEALEIFREDNVHENALKAFERRTRPGFGSWFTLLHAEFLGVSEGAFESMLHQANDVGNSGDGLLHIKMVAAYLGKVWFAGWLIIVLFVILPRTDGWIAPQKEMGNITAILITLGSFVISGLAFSVLLVPFAAAVKGTFCIDISDESYYIWIRESFARDGCGSDDEARQIFGDDEDAKRRNRPGFGYWFNLLHAELLGVSDGAYFQLFMMANDGGNSGETLLHIKVFAAYLGKIWFAGWLSCVLLIILPRTSIQKILNKKPETGVEPTVVGVVDTEQI